MRTALDRLDTAMAQGTAGGVPIVTRKGQPWISLPKLEPLAERSPAITRAATPAPGGTAA